MKIAILSSALAGKGGMETVFSNFYRLMKVTKDISLSFIFTDGVKDKKFVYSFGSNVIYHRHTNKLGEFLFLFNCLKNNKYDYIIATSKKTLIFASYIKKILRLNSPLISWIHFSISKEGMYVNLTKYGDAHFAISKQIYHQIEDMGVNKDKIYYLPNFVYSNDSIIKPAKNKFVYIGRIEFLGQKNLKELIDGLEKYNGKWSIDIYGNGPAIVQCKNYIKDNYSESINRFNWRGWEANPWSNICNATALILTSRMEGMPMVLLEAISRGLPVLSSNCPTGPAEIVNTGINGYLYKMGDLNDFLLKLKMVSNTEFDRERIKKDAAKFNETVYLQKFRDDLKNIYLSN